MVSQKGSSFSDGQVGQHTRFALLNLLCRNRENGKYFDQNFHHNVHHSCSWWNLDRNFESSEEVFDALKEVNKYLLVSADSRSYLKQT